MSTEGKDAYWSCYRKKPYSTFDFAEKMRKQLIRHGESNLHSYFCDICARWHVGHIQRKEQS